TLRIDVRLVKMNETNSIMGAQGNSKFDLGNTRQSVYHPRGLLTRFGLAMEGCRVLFIPDGSAPASSRSTQPPWPQLSPGPHPHAPGPGTAPRPTVARRHRSARAGLWWRPSLTPGLSPPSDPVPRRPFLA